LHYLNYLIDIDRLTEVTGEPFRQGIGYNWLVFTKFNPIVPLRKVHACFFFRFRGLCSIKQKCIPRSNHVLGSAIHPLYWSASTAARKMGEGRTKLILKRD